MRFEGVLDQVKQKHGFINMYINNKIPHSLLISGIDGFGGLPFALAISQYLLCENLNGNDSCNQCDACYKSKKLEHPDLHFIFPVISTGDCNYFLSKFKESVIKNPYISTFDWGESIKTKTEDKNKQLNISADECRRLIEKLTIKSFEGKIKILILWKPEYLGKEGNILLKMIEEPYEDTLIILVSENKEKILPTIISRCQEIKMSPIRTEIIAEALMRGYLID